jgi:hypothetical protein
MSPRRASFVTLVLLSLRAASPAHAQLVTTAAVTCLGLPSQPTTVVHGPGAHTSCFNALSLPPEGAGDETSRQRADVFAVHSYSFAEFVREAASADMNGTFASGDASFQDVWHPSGGQGQAMMVVPWSVTGFLGFAPQQGIAQMNAVLSLIDARGGLPATCALTSRGTCDVVLHFVFGDAISVLGDLSTLAEAIGDNNALGGNTVSVADFENTAQVAPVQFFDLAGNPLSGITLTDTDGFVIPVAGTAVLTPEPATLALMVVGLAAIGVRRSRLRARRGRGTLPTDP